MAAPSPSLSPRHGRVSHGPRGTYGEPEQIAYRAIRLGPRNVGFNPYNSPTGIRFGSLIVGGNDGAGRSLHSVNFRTFRT